MRSYRHDDMPMLLRLLAEADAWPPSASPNANQLRSRWARWGVNPEEHLRVVDGEGSTLIACWHAAPFRDTAGRMGFDITVHPRFRTQGIGSRLLQMVRDDAHRLGSTRLTCPVIISPTNDTPPGARFLIGHGFRSDHGYWQMRIDNIHTQPPPTWPAGIEVRTLSNLEEDVATWCRLVQLAFGEETTPDGVLAQMHEPGGLPYGYFFAVDRTTGLEVGTSRARIDLANTGSVGYIGTVGVLPEYRRRGIAQALVRHTLSYLAGLGLESATLYVERQNQAARRIYDAMGWRPVYRTDHYWQAVENAGH